MKTILILLLFHNVPTLTWNDYLAPVPDNDLTVAARTRTQIQFEENDTDGCSTYRIWAELIPSESWVRLRTDAVLRHENCHYQISLLEAALCQKALAPYQHKKTKPEAFIQGIIDHYSEEVDRLNAKFDEDSRHGLDSVAEKRWEEKIKREL